MPPGGFRVLNPSKRVAAHPRLRPRVHWDRQYNIHYNIYYRPPLWSSGQGFWPQIEGSGVRFPALPDFLSGSGSGTECTQPRDPREVN